MSDYHKQRDQSIIQRTRLICKDLPRFCDYFFVSIENRTSALTRLNYAYDLRIFFDFLFKEILPLNTASMTVKDLEKIIAPDIEMFLSYLSSYEFDGNQYQCGASAKSRKLATVRSFFSYYFDKDMISSNVSAKVHMPKKHDKPILRLDTNEVGNLIDTVESGAQLTKRQTSFHNKYRHRDSAIITLLLGTGIRISECVGLNKTDINFADNSFIVTRKGGNRTILYFSDEVAGSLKQYTKWLQDQIDSGTDLASKIKDFDAFFVSAQGGRLSVRAIQDLVKKYSHIISPLKNISPHKLRSTFGTHLYQKTRDIYVVADLLGHRDVNTTKKHYAAISEEIRKDAAQSVKLQSKPKEKPALTD
ncbi:MAG: tyrosine-type recombinase/integrase [Firmicutes bacterium]|nr:tyrosine-type recombinase/integrase [Bacillota bacterium]